MVGATIRTVSSPSPTQRAPASSGVGSRTGSTPPLLQALAELMDGAAEEDVLAAYAAFPSEHWQKVWSNNPLERLN